MMSLDDATDALTLLQKLERGTMIRLAIPYTQTLFDGLSSAGYVVSIERNAWNDMEIVISSPKTFDPTQSLT